MSTRLLFCVIATLPTCAAAAELASSTPPRPLIERLRSLNTVLKTAEGSDDMVDLPTSREELLSLQRVLKERCVQHPLLRAGRCVA